MSPEFKLFTGNWLCLFCVLALPLGWASSGLAQKPRVTSQDGLPRHEYPITMSASELIQSSEAFAAVASQLRADVEADLAGFDIEDKTTLKGMHQVLLQIDILEGRFEDALAEVAVLRGLEDKAGVRLTTGLQVEAMAMAAADLADGQATTMVDATRAHYRELVATLPWGEVQDVLEGVKGQMEMATPNLILGVVQSHFDPVVAESHQLTFAQAQQLLGMHVFIKVLADHRESVVEVLSAALAANSVEKPDIWADRDLDLTGRRDVSPVRILIWDTGLDPEVFANRMVVNPLEPVDGQDNDNSGFIDDVFGIGYDQHWNRVTEPLYPITESARSRTELQAMFKGIFDMRANLDTPEATALKQQLAAMKPEEVADWTRDAGRYTMHAHGTHVAGIAIAGNPAARLLYARLTGGIEPVPDLPTMEECRRGAQSFQDVVNYARGRGVRVINMSWVVQRSSFENDLAAHNVGRDAEARRAMAREMFEVMKEGLETAMSSAPEIVFVGGAGNSNNDVVFDEFFPPMLELSNLLIAGAVDQAGEATTFTSFGPTVRIYSNGFEVESFVPGGDRMKLSGTSMASPNVANLAAKLIALDYSLTPAEVIQLILEGADERQEGDHLLRIMNPLRSAELLRLRGSAAGTSAE